MARVQRPEGVEVMMAVCALDDRAETARKEAFAAPAGSDKRLGKLQEAAVLERVSRWMSDQVGF